MTDNVDPLALVVNLGRSLALSDTLGDVAESIHRAWSLAGLGEIPSADGGEPIPGCDATYDCGDLMIAPIREDHGVDGLWRKTAYTVVIGWTDEWSQGHTETVEVDADTPMDAARVAYHLACEIRSTHSIGYASAVVEGETFELEPVTCVRVCRGSSPARPRD